MKTILIIEDDAVLRENTAEFLTNEKFQVLVAEDGLTGIQLANNFVPDLILCDIGMPKLDGFEFYKIIQQIKATSTIPLIFISARAESEEIRAGMQMGADDYLTKPYDLHELLKIINIRLCKHEKIVQTGDEKFIALLDNPTVGVFIYQNKIFSYYNTALALIFGYTYDSFCLKTFDELLESPFKEDVIREIDKCLKSLRSSVHLKFEAVHQLGKTLLLELYGTVISYKGTAALIGNIIPVGMENLVFDPPYKNPYNAVKLTKRESEILKLICKGISTLEISDILFISQRTVDSHRANILSKTNCRNIAELVMYSVRNRLVSAY